MISQCPDDRALETLLEAGDLPDTGRSAIEAHLDHCVRCQDRLVALAGSTDLSGLEDDTPPFDESPSQEFLDSLKRQISLATTIDMPVTGNEAVRFVLDGSSQNWPEIPGFEIIEVIGRGGMGTVYKAIQKGIDRVVAVKVVALGDSPNDARERARRGATLLASMDHPHIVRIHHVGQEPGFVFGVLEYVAGGDLKKALREGPWPIGRAVVFMETLARVVGHLHERGIVHADLKPANVLMAGPVTPKLADFGIAKSLTPGTRVDPAVIGGTLPYMAPEQFGDTRENLAPATDVHALGVILHELLTGRSPFDARPRSTIPVRIQTLRPPAPSSIRAGIPPSLDAIVSKSLEKEQSGRFPDASAMADALKILIESRRGKSPASPSIEKN
ncbi:protein kinase [bacterium]|nr:protein kinase [bacterium]